MIKKLKFVSLFCVFLIGNLTITPNFNYLNISKNSEQLANDIATDVTNNNLEIVNVPDSATLESDQKWIDSIAESTNNNTIKLFFTRDASLVFQQSLLVMSNIITNLNNKSSNNIKNQICFCVDEDVYQNVNKFDFTIFNNMENVFLFKNSNDLDENLNESYSVIPTNQQLNLILNYYLKKFGNDIKFDIWIPDLSIASVWKNHYDGFLNFLPFVNHIYVLSDGNAQTYSFVNDYIKRVKKKFMSDDKKIENLKTLLNSEIDLEERQTLFNTTQLYDFLRLNFFTIFHIERYVDSSYYDIDLDKMYTSYIINYDYYDVANRLLNSNKNSVQEYTNFYESFFKVKDNTLENFVYDGFENYDSSKKNIVWIGDSLIRSETQVNWVRKNEIQKLFLGLTKIYDPKEYNYFFKHHPFYSSQQQKELTNFIIAQSENVKPIYFSNFPWELFLSWDKAKQSNSAEYTPFFSNTSNNVDVANTTLIGIQYSTTVILSTYFFISKQYNMNLDDAWKSIDSVNFPIPGSFDVVNRGNSSINEYFTQVEINKEKINKIYDPYIALNKFNKLEDNQKNVYDFLKNLNIDFENEIKANNETFTNKNESKAIVIATTIAATIAAIAIISITTIVLIKRKKIKKQKQIKNPTPE